MRSILASGLVSLFNWSGTDLGFDTGSSSIESGLFNAGVVDRSIDRSTLVSVGTRTTREHTCEVRKRRLRWDTELNYQSPGSLSRLTCEESATDDDTC